MASTCINLPLIETEITNNVTVVEPLTVEQPTHDSLNSNANIQVADVDVSNSNPVPVSDAGGSLTVDGAVAATQSGTWNVDTVSTITNAVHVDDNGGSLTVDGTVSANQGGTWTVTATQDTGTNLHTVIDSSALPTGAATLEEQQTQTASLSVIDDWDESDRAKVNIIVGQAGITAGAGSVSTNSPRVTLASDDPAVTSLQVIDDWDESDRAKVNLIVGQAGVQGGSGAISSSTQRVVIATDQPKVAVEQVTYSTATVTSVNASASNVTLLASNSNRIHAAFYNDSGATLYLKFGATASTTSFTVKLLKDAYFELPEPAYTGIIDGIWSSASGAVRVTEVTK